MLATLTPVSAAAAATCAVVGVLFGLRFGGRRRLTTNIGRPESDA
jgi:hypothetical protein